MSHIGASMQTQEETSFKIHRARYKIIVIHLPMELQYEHDLPQQKKNYIPLSQSTSLWSREEESFINWTLFPASICMFKVTIETLELGVEYVQS